jgi:hypothetical protein
MQCHVQFPISHSSLVVDLERWQRNKSLLPLALHIMQRPISTLLIHNNGPFRSGISLANAQQTKVHPSTNEETARRPSPHQHGNGRSDKQCGNEGQKRESDPEERKYNGGT